MPTAIPAAEVSEVSEPPAGPGERRVRGTSADVWVAILFLAVGYYVTSRMWVSPSGVTAAPNRTDQTQFEWMLTHAVRVFTHGENPLFTRQLNAPLGANLMANTGLVGLTIPFAPLTAIFGPSVVFVLITTLGLSGTAYAWYHVLSRHFVKDRVAGVVGGLFAGFAPGVVSHANAHPNLVAQFVLPLIVWRALALRDSRRPVRHGAILGLLVAYQAFLNEELLFLTALGGTLYVMGYVAFRPRVVISAAKPMAIGLGVAALVGTVLLAYPLYFQFYGPQSFSGLPLNLQDGYRLPLVSWVTRPTLTMHAVDTASGLASATEQNGFLGWTMVVVVVGIIAARAYRRVEVRALGLVAVVFAWASLGDRVSVRDIDPARAVPAWSLWRFVNKIPLFDSVLPSRLGLILVPVIATLLAIAVADCRRYLKGPAADQASGTRPAVDRPVRHRAPSPVVRRRLVAGTGLAAVAVAVASVLPTPVSVAPRPSVPRFFASGDWRRYIPVGSSVFNAQPAGPNNPNNTAAMRWAVTQNLDFGIVGGYFLGPAAEPVDAQHPNVHRGQFGPQSRATLRLLNGAAYGHAYTAADIAGRRQQAIVDLKFWHTSAIVLAELDRPYADQLRVIIDELVGPGVRVDDVWVWDTRWTWTATRPTGH